MHNLRADVLELFKEAQHFDRHDLPGWMAIVPRPLPAGCFMCGHRIRHRPETCAEVTVLGRDGVQKLRAAGKNARQAAKNPRRAYRSAWQAEKDLKDAMNKLRAGYVPIRWGKRWRAARDLLEKESAG